MLYKIIVNGEAIAARYLDAETVRKYEAQPEIRLETIAKGAKEA